VSVVLLAASISLLHASFNDSHKAQRRTCLGTCKFCRRFLFLARVRVTLGCVVVVVAFLSWFPYFARETHSFPLLLLSLLLVVSVPVSPAPPTHLRRPHSPICFPSGMCTTCLVDVTACSSSNLPLLLVVVVVVVVVLVVPPFLLISSSSGSKMPRACSARRACWSVSP